MLATTNEENLDYEQLAIEAGLLVKIDDTELTTWTGNPPENALRKFASLILKNSQKINDAEFEKAFSFSFGYQVRKDSDGEYEDVNMRDAKCLWDYKNC